MRILLSNDDGVYAPGLKILYQALIEITDVVVVAPDRDRSAAGKSLTLVNPLRPHELDDGFISLNGTPTDCVYLALMGYLHNRPDMVIAGINHGANLGDDVLYSGTVAAATEGRFLGYPAMAISLAGSQCIHYESAAKVAQILTQQIIDDPLPPDTILNINVPDLPFNQLKGIQVTRLGARHQSEGVIKTKDPRGRTIYWVGSSGTAQEKGPGTDFHAVQQGYVSVTPLQVDLTRYESLPLVSNWVKNILFK